MDLPNFESIPTMPNEGQAPGVPSQIQEVQRNAAERNFKKPENETKDKTTVPVPSNLSDADSATVSQNAATTSPKVDKAKTRKIPRKTKLANKEQDVMKNEIPIKEKVKHPRKISLKKRASTQKEKGKTLTDLTRVDEDIERVVGSDSEPENDVQLTVHETEIPLSHPLPSKRPKRARAKKSSAKGVSPEKPVRIKRRKKSGDAKSTKKRTIHPEKQGTKRRKHSGEPSKEITDVTDEISDSRSGIKSPSRGKDSTATQRYSRSVSPPVASRKSRTSPTREAGKKFSARTSTPKSPPTASEDGGNVKGGGSRKRASRSLKVEGISGRSREMKGSRHNSRKQPSANDNSPVRSPSETIKRSSVEDSREMHDSISQNAEIMKLVNARSPKRRRLSSNGTLNEQPEHSRKMPPAVAAAEKSRSNSKHIDRSLDKHYKLSYGETKKPLRLGGTQRKQLKAPSRKRGQKQQQANRKSSKRATRRRSKSQKQGRGGAKSQQSQKKRMYRKKRKSAIPQTRQKSSVAKGRRKTTGRRSVGRYRNE